ncbi:MAG: hypothetical protein JJU29_13135 [Verrucomicrobia bacterium]|nr:hypothetical protein [Verrucomicrobiota bacterium]
MNFKDMNDQTHQVLTELMQHRLGKSPFWGFYQKIRKQHREYFAEAKKENVSENKFQNIHQNFVGQVNGIVQQTDLGRVFVSLHEQTEALKEALGQAPLLKEGAENLLSELEELWGRLTELMRKPQHFPLIIDILDRCERIEQQFLYFENCQRFLANAGELLNESTEPPENFAVIDLGFSAEIRSLADLNFRLNSLQVVYTETCLLFGVKETEFPLTVSKVETGSLWSRLFGESKVIDFIIWFFKGGIRYLHRTFTVEGKLARIPVDVQTLGQQLDLHRKLKELLPEDRYSTLVTEQREVLAKSCVLIAKHTQNLLEREAKLRIDSEVLQLEYPYHEKYLKAAAKQLPEHSTFKVIEPESVEKIVPPSDKPIKEKASEDQQEN